MRGKKKKNTIRSSRGRSLFDDQEEFSDTFVVVVRAELPPLETEDDYERVFHVESLLSQKMFRLFLRRSLHTEIGEGDFLRIWVSERYFWSGSRRLAAVVASRAEIIKGLGSL